MDNVADLRALLHSPHRLVLAESDDERRLLGVLRSQAAELGHDVWRWSTTRGLAKDGYGPQFQTQDIHVALDFCQDVRLPAVFVFADGHHMLEDPRIVRHVKETAQNLRPAQTLLLTAPSHDVPPELASEATVWTLRPPDETELRSLITRTVRDLRARNFPVDLGGDDIDRLVRDLRGLSTTQAERIIQKATYDNGVFDRDDLPAIRAAKAEIFTQGGILELIEADTGTLDDVGGLSELKSWLALRHRAHEPRAREMGIDPPKGVLLTGIPGTGKSYVAKTLARTWDLPLVLLDPARLYSKYIGETEKRLSAALAAVDGLAPAVLWIDEIEKGFATDSGDSGTSERLLGTFLRWMQDRQASVFIVATANDVSKLPPEFLRRGRFDEIFFVDLPSSADRAAIFELHLRRRGYSGSHVRLDDVVEASEAFSGAEIEAAIVGALYRSLETGQDLDTGMVLEELKATVPLAHARAEDIQALRAWAATRAVTA